MKITLDGEQINMLANFENIRKVEQEVGSPFHILNKIATRGLTFTDIVVIYYYMQDGSAYSQEKIFDKIHKDTYKIHVANVLDLVNYLLGVNEETKKKTEELATSN